MLFGTFVTSWAVEAQNARSLLAIIGAVALGFGILITLMMKVMEYDNIWFGARAIAESVKTLAWRYMAHAEPYGTGLSPHDADEILCREIARVLKERHILGAVLGGQEASSEEISDAMRHVREQDTATRKDIYIRDPY